MDVDLAKQIQGLARKKNAVILAHNYQSDEIQSIADHTGDSLELARIAARNDYAIIAFCGVHFMAESASILSPTKKVLLPDPDAGCPMADMVTAADVREMRRKHPDAMVITYINSSAAVKAESDVCCTSANAITIVNKVQSDKIIFVPDRNLGAYVQRFTQKQIIPWRGFCPTHERFTLEALESVRRQYPDALVMVHPECRPEVIDRSDVVLSTGQMVKFVQETNHRRIIVGTEMGMIYKLKSVAPQIEYILAANTFICPNMKKITPEKLYRSLADEVPVIRVDPETASRARLCLDRMLELS